MTGPEIMAVVGFILMLFGAVFAVWRYIDGKLVSLRSSQEVAALALQEHRLHVAETYATKAGMQEQTAQLLRAIEGVGNRIDGLHERLDRAFEKPSRRPG